MRGFPIGSLESRVMARMRAQKKRNERKRIEIITNVQFPQHEVSQATDNSVPYAYPWQETTDGGLMRIVYCPGGMEEAACRNHTRLFGLQNTVPQAGAAIE
jgi:hypothetical protein